MGRRLIKTAPDGLTTASNVPVYLPAPSEATGTEAGTDYSVQHPSPLTADQVEKLVIGFMDVRLRTLLMPFRLTR